MQDSKQDAFSEDRARVARELEAAGWYGVAEDVRDGLPAGVILRRLRDIGEAHSEASELVGELHQ